MSVARVLSAAALVAAMAYAAELRVDLKNEQVGKTPVDQLNPSTEIANTSISEIR